MVMKMFIQSYEQFMTSPAVLIAIIFFLVSSLVFLSKLLFVRLTSAYQDVYVVMVDLPS